MFKKIIVLGTILIMTVSIFYGCEEKKLEQIPYNATIINGDFKDSFLSENRIYGTPYKNENWNPEDPTSEEYLYDKTSPQTRTFIVTDQAMLDEMFKDFRYQIDFETQMLIVYFYTDLYMRPQILTQVNLEGRILRINFRTELGKSSDPWHHDATEPYQRLLVVRLNKLSIDNVEVFKS